MCSYLEPDSTRTYYVLLLLIVLLLLLLLCFNIIIIIIMFLLLLLLSLLLLLLLPLILLPPPPTNTLCIMRMLPSRHMTLMQRRLNVDASTLRQRYINVMCLLCYLFMDLFSNSNTEKFGITCILDGNIFVDCTRRLPTRTYVLSMKCWSPTRRITLRTHDVYTTSLQRRCNVKTLHRCWGDVV